MPSMSAPVGVGRPLDRALRYAGGSHTLEDIDAAVERGDLQRWDGDCSTIITEIKQTPQAAHLALLSGRRGYDRTPGNGAGDRGLGPLARLHAGPVDRP